MIACTGSATEMCSIRKSDMYVAFLRHITALTRSGQLLQVELCGLSVHLCVCLLVIG